MPVIDIHNHMGYCWDIFTENVRPGHNWHYFISDVHGEKNDLQTDPMIIRKTADGDWEEKGADEGEGDVLIPATPPAFLVSATATRLPW